MTDLFGTGTGTNNLFGSTTSTTTAGTDNLFGGSGTNNLFGTPAPAPAPGTNNGLSVNTGTSSTDNLFGSTTGSSNLFGSSTTTTGTTNSSTALSFGNDMFNTSTTSGGVSGLFNAPAPAAGAANTTAGAYDVKSTKEKVEYHVPTFLTDIENHFREMGYADGTGGGYQDFTHLYPVDRAVVSQRQLPRTDAEVREAVGEERWKEKSELLGNTQQIALQYEKGVFAFASSIAKLEKNVSSWRKNLKNLLDNQLNAVKAKIEKVEIDYLRSYDLQKYLHRRVLVVLANKVCCACHRPRRAECGAVANELSKSMLCRTC